ncbi:anti-phage-associated helicase HerA [Denitrificimonas caeni]|uniref:ATP-binding protein n=1 Tax=Denitrificimonas caeni TaxID=521720 RepID=A0AAE9VLW0_9GAMM|nr:anti-phage-associated helicase HerA [Denitrificimonas caeni]WBE24480.1 ATP-binding protein [Denitrificimonas caeni]
MLSRTAIGYVVQIDGGQVTLNLLDHHRGQMASHYQGVTPVGEVGGLLVLDGGYRLFVLKISGLNFSEPKEIHRPSASNQSHNGQPLRHLHGTVIGWVEAGRFVSDNLASPPLGAEAFPLTGEESQIVIGGPEPDGPITLGTEYKTGNSVRTGLNRLLAQHIAVLGSSGQGKSCFTAAVLQQLADMPNSRIVIFDINGEYDRAFRRSESAIAADDMECRLPEGAYQHTVIGEDADGAQGYRIPYYALGRQGLNRLLLPSEKTQRPALSFAIDNLKYVHWHPAQRGASIDGVNPVLFDDCRQNGAADADRAINTLRERQGQLAQNWPHMAALSALVAESHSLAPNNRGAIERNGFQYGNVSPLITRVHRLVDDEMLRAVVDVSGGASVNGGNLDMRAEGEYLVDKIFGCANTQWRVHVVNLRQVPQDLMPLVLGSMLELYSQVLFRRGQGNSPATLLVLEEAHHYLRPVPDGDSGASSLAYERLAKEGRKFGLSLWLSTQRPSEVSPTVLSQCNTWVSFRLTSEQDLRVIASACEWADKREVSRIAGLPRQHALLMGGAVALPTCIKAMTADPTPKSEDGKFDGWIE